MRARWLAAVTSAGVLAVSLSGCITVHGETAVVPAVGKAEARKALRHFTVVNNKANKRFDARLNTTIETGAQGAIDQVGLKARKEVHPGGDENFEPLRLTDARFLIPEQAGWPKFFVADVASNRAEGGDRWYLVFQRGGVTETWKVSYLAVVSEAEAPEFVTDANGRAEAVPLGEESHLAIAPEDLSTAYTDYLADGGAGFADGPHTSTVREQREEAAGRRGVRTQWADLPARPPQFAPFGLRTEDGGAMVFFASRHHQKQTVAKGYKPKVSDAYVKAIMTGTPKKSITHVRVSAQAVAVPPAGEGRRTTFLSRVTGLTAAKGS
jgi:hypothetical protein